MQLIIISILIVLIFVAQRVETSDDDDFGGLGGMGDLYDDGVPVPTPKILYDYKYSLLWGKGLCKKQVGVTCLLPEPPSGETKRPLPNRFTIHGLWYLHEKDVTATKTQFDLSDFSRSFQDDLHDDWPAVRFMTKANDIIFWEHEWTKHGVNDPLFQNGSPKEYFEYIHSLYLTRFLHLSEILNVKRPTKASEVKNLYEDHMTPKVYCVKNKTGSYFLKELIFCLDDKADGFMKCDEGPDSEDCPDQVDILYE